MPNDLSPILSRALGSWKSHAASMARALSSAGIGLEAFEASVRFSERDEPRGGRLIIEHLRAHQAKELLASLLPMTPLAEALVDLGRREGLSLIAGWDIAGSKLKLYLNASDASARLRERLREALLPGEAGGPEAPHIIGINFSNGESELKLYEQAASLFGDTPAPLRAWADSQPVAGFVRSFNLRAGGFEPKAWFVALRAGSDVNLHGIPGFTDAGLERAAPFSPGPIKYVSLSSGLPSWTVYFKPEAIRGNSWTLEPFACFSNGESEVGIFLEPAEGKPRAFAYTNEWAVSCRVREGSPRRDAIESLMRWCVSTLEQNPDPAALFATPPPPWKSLRRKPPSE